MQMRKSERNCCQYRWKTLSVPVLRAHGSCTLNVDGSPSVRRSLGDSLPPALVRPVHPVLDDRGHLRHRALPGTQAFPGRSRDADGRGADPDLPRARLGRDRRAAAPDLRCPPHQSANLVPADAAALSQHRLHQLLRTKRVIVN